MKILAINNYDLEWAYNEPFKVPMHQTWGVDYMRELICLYLKKRSVMTL